jgi:rod shape-determining protein MreB
MSVLDSFWKIFTYDLGLDLGTANTMVYLRGEGIVVSEPSVVAIDKRSKKVLAVGQDAREMIGRTPANIVAIRPLKDGVISDFDTTQAMIHHFINMTHSTIESAIIAVHTPEGIVLYGNDYKLDNTPVFGDKPNYISSYRETLMRRMQFVP